MQQQQQKVQVREQQMVQLIKLIRREVKQFTLQGSLKESVAQQEEAIRIPEAVQPAIEWGERHSETRKVFQRLLEQLGGYQFRRHKTPRKGHRSHAEKKWS